MGFASFFLFLDPNISIAKFPFVHFACSIKWRKRTIQVRRERERAATPHGCPFWWHGNDWERERILPSGHQRKRGEKERKKSELAASEIKAGKEWLTGQHREKRDGLAFFYGIWASLTWREMREGRILIHLLYDLYYYGPAVDGGEGKIVYATHQLLCARNGREKSRWGSLLKLDMWAFFHLRK